MRISHRLLLTTLVLVLFAAGVLARPAIAQEQPDFPAVPALAETEPTPGGNATQPVIWLHPTDLTQSTIVGTDSDSGLYVYGLAGEQIQRVRGSGYSNIDLRYNFPLGGEPTTIATTGHEDDSIIKVYRVNPETRELEDVTAREIVTGVDGIDGLCMYRSSATNLYYTFATDPDGNVEQYELFDDGNGMVDARLVRSFNVGSEIEACAADDMLGNLFIAEGEVALWRYGAEPEDGTARRVIDFVGGNIAEELEGVGIYYGAGEAGYIIASNQTEDAFNVYERSGGNRFLGSFRIAEGENADGAVVDGVQEPNGLAFTSLALNDRFAEGIFVVADDVNTDPDERSNFKVASWGDIARALDLTIDTSYDPRAVGAVGSASATEASTTIAVSATVQTESVLSGRDAADDPVVWVHPTDPALSTIIGTDKQGGMNVFDMEGNRLQFSPDGDINNVDLRYDFPLGGDNVALVGATNRTTNGLQLYRVNPETRMIEDVAARPITAVMTEVYGFCMYRSAATGTYYAIINSTNVGDVEQYELFDNGDGQVDARLVRTFRVGTQTEGCVADDETGALYIGEEGVGIWRYGAEPDAGEERAMVDSMSPEGHLTPDVEGLAIYYAAEGAGYLIASSQGSSTFVIYTRATNEYVGTFAIVEGNGIDGVSGTDGLDVMNLPLGPAFPEGVFVAQDDARVNPDGNQNYKLVPWGDIARTFEPPLLIDNEFDFRTIGR